MLPTGGSAARAQTAVGATLSILAPVVEVAAAGGDFSLAQDGQTLRPGDLVRSGPSGVALLTFFDGSETQLTGNTQIELDTSSRGYFQAGGTTVNRIQVPAGAGFATDTPPATAFVRGTTYVVTVKRLPPAVPIGLATSSPIAAGQQPVDGAAAPVADGNAADVPPAADGNDPTAPSRAGDQTEFPHAVDGSPYLLLNEVAFVDDSGERWRDDAWQDADTGVTWDTYDDLGPADQSAAAVRAAQPPGPAAVCSRADVATCLAATVLLADPDGRVGHVELVSHAALPAVDLVSACQVGAMGVLQVSSMLSALSCAQLRQSTLNLRDVTAARLTQQQADEIFREVSGPAAPRSPPPPPPPGPPPGGPGQIGPPSVLGPNGAAVGPTSLPPTAAGAPPPPATWTATDAARFGIDEGFRNPAALTDSGATWERLVVPWTAVQPDGPTDFSHLDQTLPRDELQAELSRGIHPAGLLEFTPLWAQAHQDQGQRSVPKNLNLAFDDPNNYFGRFVYETVSRYAGRIDEWIVWNEPEFKPGDVGGGGSFTWLGSDEEFAQLLKVAYLAAKKANPHAVVVFPGTSYWIDQNNHRSQFYERMLGILTRDADASRNNWYHDAVGLNLYRDPDDVLRIHRLFKDIQRRYGLDKPLWLTESNAMPTDDAQIPCRHADDPISTTLEQQAAYVIQTFAIAAAAGYERAGFYQMVDDDPCRQPAVWGAVRDDGSRRPAADALRTAFMNFSGFTRARFVPLARPEQRWATWPNDPTALVPNWQVYQVAFDKPGNTRITVLWNGDASPTCVRLPKSGATAHAIDKRGAPVLLQDQNGRWQLTLGPATAHFTDDPDGYYFIGGEPVLVVEDGTGAAAPVIPTSTGCGG